jgi:hypothetical protein
MNLKKNGKAFTSKFVGTGPSYFKKKNLPGRGLTKFEKHCTRVRRWQEQYASCDSNLSPSQDKLK